MARFTYEEMCEFIEFFELDARLQKREREDAYVITRNGKTEIIAEFVGNPVGGYTFRLNKYPSPEGEA